MCSIATIATAAPELYAPLTGPHGWRFAPGRPLIVKPAGEPVWNPPLQPHLTKVGPHPFLCLFAWTRDVSLPATRYPCSGLARSSKHCASTLEPGAA